MEIIILAIVFGLAIIPVAISRAMRKNKPKKSKEERRAESIIAVVFILILALFVFLRETVINDRVDDVLRDAETSQVN